MKNTIKLLGIIAIVAVIGFSMASCGDEGEVRPDEWVTQDGITFYFDNLEKVYQINEIEDNVTSITIPAKINGFPVIIPDYGNYEYADLFLDKTNLQAINVDPANKDFSSAEGVLYNKNKSALLVCPQGKTGEISIPNSTTSIRTYAFYNCTGITGITIPNSVTSIRSSAFSSCTGISNITIPTTVTEMGPYVFRYWTDAQTIIVPFASEDDRPYGWNHGYVGSWIISWLTDSQAVVQYTP